MTVWQRWKRKRQQMSVRIFYSYDYIMCYDDVAEDIAIEKYVVTTNTKLITQFKENSCFLFPIA